MTTLNAFFPLTHSLEEFMNTNSIEGSSNGHTFDTMTLRDTSTFEVTDDDGHTRTLPCNERYYMPSEITWMMKALHFSMIDIFGCQVGNFRRGMPLTPSDHEMLVVATMD